MSRGIRGDKPRGSPGRARGNAAGLPRRAGGAIISAATAAARAATAPAAIALLRTELPRLVRRAAVPGAGSLSRLMTALDRVVDAFTKWLVRNRCRRWDCRLVRARL